MRAACHSEPVLSTVASGPSDDDLQGPPGLCLDRARSLSTPSAASEKEDPELAAADYEGWRARHPCLLTHFDDFQKQLEGRRLAVFLDYDGTLTPIVSNPEAAIMSEQMREAVRQVAGMFPTAIISGRGREKVESFVRLPELFYAGSHGMDIVGPRGAAVNGGAAGAAAGAGGHAGGGSMEPFRFQAAAEYQPLIDRVYHQLRESLGPIPGASVEHNKFCVSAHFRNCHPDSWQRVVAAVDSVVAASGGGRLHVTRGRKVLEVRPTVDWDKGSALLHLLSVLGLTGQPDVTAVYLGDDKTDEDAFAALAGAGAGAGVLVSTVAKPTAAAFTLRDPGEVLQLLQRLVAYGAGDGNGWRTYGGRCNGWSPAAAGKDGGAGHKAPQQAEESNGLSQEQQQQQRVRQDEQPQHQQDQDQQHQQRHQQQHKAPADAPGRQPASPLQQGAGLAGAEAQAHSKQQQPLHHHRPQLGVARAAD